jgi:hypothetical protein
MNNLESRYRGHSWNCTDCNINTRAIGDDYMITDALWADAGMSDDGMLCLECLAKRLARPLRTIDFQPVPINFKNSIRRALWCSKRLYTPAAQKRQETPNENPKPQ